jgi:hypothetical protein
VCCSLNLGAQSWDAATKATSWAKQDKDDSFTFHDPGARELHTWMRDGGVTGSIPLLKLEGAPERWLVDPRNTAWVAQGTTLTQLDQSGRILTTVKLPAEVGDLCWDVKGFVLSYRTPEAYLEKRDYKGNLLWSFGPRGQKGSSSQYRRPVVTDDQGLVAMADGPSLNLSVLDGESGKKVRETALLLGSGQPAPALEGSPTDRGPIVTWPGKSIVLAALKATQIPAAHRDAIQGLALARVDLLKSRVEFLPTGLDETHILIGVLEGDAVFVSPKGGLLLVKLK